MTSNLKWSKKDNTYMAVEQQMLVDRIEPGSYDVGATMFGVYLEKKDIKTDELLLLPRSATGKVIEELETFWNSRSQFDKYGFLFKRGILLYGPPGSGKTSLINLVIEGATKRGAVCLKMYDVGLVKSGIKMVRKVEPDTPIVIFIEDVDEWDDDPDLLDILDGSTQVDNIVFIATTNYIEHLPARIKNRPSRFDRKIEVGHPEPEARRLYLEHISKGKMVDHDMTSWVEQTEGLSFAHIKELFIAVIILGNKFHETIDSLREMNADDFDEDESEY